MYEVDRTRRVAELLRRELSVLIPRELNDQRISNVVINSVTITKDLKNAVVYVSKMEAIAETSVEKKIEETIEVQSTKKGKSSISPEQQRQYTIEKLLNNASGYLRHHLTQHVELRIMPTLNFKYDDSIERGIVMSQLIDSLNTTDKE